MNKKIRVGVKAASILSGGVILVTGMNHYMISEVGKLGDKVGTIKLNHDSFEDNDYLNDIYSKLVSTISEHDTIKDRYKLKEISRDVWNYVPSLSTDDFCYTFFKGCTRINLLNDGKCYATCEYYDDGHYSISCSYNNEIENILNNIDKNNDQDFDYWFRYQDKFDSITYNFNTDGVLTDSQVSGSSRYNGKFVYSDDNINKYDFSIYLGGGYELFLTKGDNYIVHDISDSLNVDFFSKYNDIVDIFYDKNPKSSYIFNNSFYDVQYKFDKNYKFNSIEAVNDNGEYLKIDNSKNLDYKRVKMSSSDDTFYDHVYSDNNTIRIVSDLSLDGEKATYDSIYDKNGDLVSKKLNDKTIYSYKDGKEYYYDNDKVDYVVENKNNDTLTHYYEDGELVKSLSDNYSINYDKGQVCSVEVTGDKASLDVNGVSYNLGKDDSLSFENGLLKRKKISNETWNYYPDGSVSSYINDSDKLYLCYDEAGNITGCSLNYLNDYYKEAFNPSKNFDYLMSNIDTEHQLDYDFSNDFKVYFKGNYSIVSGNGIEFSFNGDKLYNMFYQSYDKDSKFSYYNVSIFDDYDNEIIYYDGTYSDGTKFKYSTQDGILHENVSKTK